MRLLCILFVLFLSSTTYADYWDVLWKDITKYAKVKGERIQDHCGRNRYHAKFQAPINKRIIGGEKSREGEWPWLVSLMLDYTPVMENVIKMEKGETFTKKPRHICGGILISATWVLTAAHCFESKWHKMLTNDTTKWTARLGEHNMKLKDADQYDLDIVKIILHPLRKHDTQDHKNDIALLKLSKPAHLGRNVAVACLPSPTDKFTAGQVCTAAGWGVTKEEGFTSEVPRHVKIPLISHVECEELFFPIYQMRPIYKIVDTMLCAGDDQGGKDSCQFDSGGPLMCQSSQDGQWVVSGIISYGIGCANIWPGVYTRVTSFVDWIKDTVAANGK